MNLHSDSAAIRRQSSMAALLTASLLTACGGGGSEDTADSSVIPAGYARFAGTITDSSGLPLQGADVAVPFGKSSAWAGRTDANGRYDFDAKASDYAGVSPVAMTVSKEGYRPRTLYYTSVAGGPGYSYTSDSTNSPAKLAINEVVPKNSAGVWHVGYDIYGGGTNSQLQTGSRGDGLVFDAGSWTADLKAKYRSATHKFSARGVEVACKDSAGLGAGAVSPFQYLSARDASGGSTRYRLNLDTSTIAVGASVVVFVRSGTACATAGDAMDDFEFTEVLLTLNS